VISSCPNTQTTPKALLGFGGKERRELWSEGRRDRAIPHIFCEYISEGGWMKILVSNFFFNYYKEK